METDWEKERETTHRYIWYLAERLVFEVGQLLVLARHEVYGNELVGDVALFGNDGHATGAK